MQQAGWLPTTPIDLPIPDWVSAWFGVYPTVEGLTAQFVAAALILGSYFAASRKRFTADAVGFREVS
jgi:high-affinity iron transporter